MNKETPEKNRNGPHEGRELELMLTGEKPLALFYDTIPECGVIPEQAFAPYVKSGKVVSSERIFQSPQESVPSVRVVFYARLEEAWRMDDALKIMEKALFQHGRPNDDDDAQLGRLLGYSEEDIRQFLAS
ncbi:MAG: hypothetical protein HN377_01015 [Alphaproteobacteria bacterium]|nr:hypothetical protein [Alphaproteobacteria bacterium]MBT7943607.1 hypothetical protein [Alphaproteobacteria bacterium]